MRIIVISDSHHRGSLIQEIINRNSDVSAFFFLGDGLKSFLNIAKANPDKSFYAVRGNCDYDAPPNISFELIVDILGVKIFMTHGHKYDVNYGEFFLVKKANEVGASIALYGHTHVAVKAYLNKIHVMNPGSISCSRSGSNSYGFIDILGDSIVTNIVEIDY